MAAYNRARAAAGAKLRVSTDDFAFQVGRGASGCNVEHGAACSLGLAVTAQPDQGAQLTSYMQIAKLDYALGGCVVMDGYPLPPLCDNE